ncbi:MAG: PEP/pyruvate-binding domain-containing protein [Methylophilaceae bacterium]
MRFSKLLVLVIFLFVGSAEAKRLNPALMKPVTDAQSETEHHQAQDQTQASNRVWQPEVNDLATWHQLSKPMRDTEYGKFVIDTKTNKIYFVDSHVFTLHADFVVDYLQKKPRTRANMFAYNQNYSTKKPAFILGYITHYPSIKQGVNNEDLWTFSFWEGDTIQAKDIQRAYKRLAQTFKITKFKYRPDSSAQERVANQLKPYRIAVINNNQIYQASPYQAFNAGRAIGRLVIVPPSTKVENLYFNENDIVLLQTSYPDISPVAGVITSQFSTPLSHVNLRASAWGIPNATIKSAAKKFKLLANKPVFYEVTEAGYTLRAATTGEVAQHQAIIKEKSTVVMPPANLTETALLPLNQISINDANKYGAKTSNLGEMMRAKLSMNSLDGTGEPLNIPDGFGIPFSYYVTHLKHHHLGEQIQLMLRHAKFNQDASWRKKALADLRLNIMNAPMQAEDLKKVTLQWRSQLASKSVFVRSSTNAEDLKGFNGAGLYDTVPNVKNEKALEAAIKQVWASVWNLRAVEERMHFGIKHEEVYPAVLIQAAVNATAAGVLLTTDTWGHQPSTFTINAKWGLGMRVVEGQKVAEQILFDTSNDGTRVVSRSDETTMLVASPQGGTIEKPVPKGDTILTEKRAKVLGGLAQKVTNIFQQIEVLDIEWVLEAKDGKEIFWIVQARPYVVKK